MEDVILHYRPGTSEALHALVERTEKLLKPFPCRPTPVFRPWFPADRHLPIRPAKPAPIISTDDGISPLGAHTKDDRTEEIRAVSPCRNQEPSPLGAAQQNPFDDETPEKITSSPETISPSILSCKETHIASLFPEKQEEEGLSVRPKRSWSICTHKRAARQNPKLLSRHFHHMVSTHRLHLRQRAKWIIQKCNCGSSQDIEKVWEVLCASVRSPELPTCNANIQRQLHQIWVYCDVLHAEPVGRFLKEHLQLSGRIKLHVHRIGNIYSM